MRLARICGSDTSTVSRLKFKSLIDLLSDLFGFILIFPRSLDLATFYFLSLLKAVPFVYSGSPALQKSAMDVAGLHL